MPVTRDVPPLRVPSGGLQGLAVDDDVVVMGGGDHRMGTVTTFDRRARVSLAVAIRPGRHLAA
jgi:hypothetical protein